MKRRGASFFFAGLTLSLLLAGTLKGDLQRGDYSQTNPGSLSQPAPRAQPSGATYAVDAYPLYRPELEPGEDRELAEAYCNTCHSTRYITMQPPLPAATWEAEVNKMIHVFGQAIPEDASPKIIKYLQTHYTPETRKR